MATKVREMFEGWEKWQIAVAISAPVALGVAGLWYYRRQQRQKLVSQIDKNEIKEPTPPKQKQVNVLDKAQEAKNHGNKNFKAGKYAAAIDCYTEAITMCPKQYKSDISTFYQNRAAAHDHLKNHLEVIKDCDMAITLNGRYTKAFLRRAKAHEQLGNLMESLMDLTAVCILESFKNPNNLQTADRILKELGRTHAHEAFKNHVPSMPSKHFVRNYFNGFANDPILKWTPSSERLEDIMRDDVKEDEDLKITEDTDDRIEKLEKGSSVDKIQTYKLRPFHKAREDLLRERYDDIISLCSEEIADSESHDEAPALLLRATFYMLRGEMTLAKQDLNRLIENESIDKKIRVNALIKRGSLLLQEEQQIDSLTDFATAVRIDPENCDVYHHRGQQNLLLDRINDAKVDFERSIQLNPEHAISHVQKCYGDYKEAVNRQYPAQLKSAVKNFADVVKRFPQCPDGHMLYAQALADEMRYEESDQEFSEALRIDPENAQTIVHQALLNLQWKQDIDLVCRMMEEAIRVDQKNEFAYETLGTLKVQQGDLTTALELFDKAIELCRSESEMAHIFSLKNAAKAQVKVAKNLGMELPSLV